MVQINSPEDDIINSFSKEDRWDELLCYILTELSLNGQDKITANWVASCIKGFNIPVQDIAEKLTTPNIDRERLNEAVIAKILKQINQY